MRRSLVHEARAVGYEGGKGEVETCVASEDAEGALDVAIDGSGLGDDLGDAVGGGEVLHVAEAVGREGLDVEGVLVDEGGELVGVLEEEDEEGGVVALAVDSVIGDEHLVVDVVACGGGEVVAYGVGGGGGAIDHEWVEAEEVVGIDGVDSVVLVEEGVIDHAAVAMGDGEAVAVLVAWVVVDGEADGEDVEDGIDTEGLDVGDAGFEGHACVCGDVVVAALDADGYAVVFLHDVVEEVAAVAHAVGTVVAAVDADNNVGLRHGMDVAGVEEEAAVGVIDEELLVGRGDAVEDKL